MFDTISVVNILLDVYIRAAAILIILMWVDHTFRFYHAGGKIGNFGDRKGRVECPASGREVLAENSFPGGTKIPTITAGTAVTIVELKDSIRRFSLQALASRLFGKPYYRCRKNELIAILEAGGRNF